MDEDISEAVGLVTLSEQVQNRSHLFLPVVVVRSHILRLGVDLRLEQVVFKVLLVLYLRVVVGRWEDLEVSIEFLVAAVLASPDTWLDTEHEWDTDEDDEDEGSCEVRLETGGSSNDVDHGDWFLSGGVGAGLEEHVDHHSDNGWSSCDFVVLIQ